MVGGRRDAERCTSAQIENYRASSRNQESRDVYFYGYLLIASETELIFFELLFFIYKINAVSIENVFIQSKIINTKLRLSFWNKLLEYFFLI